MRFWRNRTSIGTVATGFLYLAACSSSHPDLTADLGTTDSGTFDAGLDANVVDFGSSDGGTHDACTAFSCMRICGASGGRPTCIGTDTVASNCDGTCPSGYAYDCSAIIEVCVGDAGVDAGPEDWTTCTYNTDCSVVPASCCGLCGVASASDMTAVNNAHVSDYSASVCTGSTGCPACAGQVDNNLVATCESNHCVANDLRASPVEGCTSDSECRVRAVGCCECGSESEGPYIAINASQDGAYQALVCDPLAGACATEGCTAYPSFPVARCLIGGASGPGYCFLDWGAD